MDWNCDAGSREKLPPFEGPQAASDSEGRVAAPSTSVARRQDCCQQKSGSIGFNQWRLCPQFQQAPGLSGTKTSNCFVHKAISIQYRRISTICTNQRSVRLLCDTASALEN